MEDVMLVKYIKEKLVDVSYDKVMAITESMLILNNYRDAEEILACELNELLDGNEVIIDFLLKRKYIFRCGNYYCLGSAFYDTCYNAANFFSEKYPDVVGSSF
jgi:hypothetical protein